MNKYTIWFVNLWLFKKFRNYELTYDNFECNMYCLKKYIYYQINKKLKAAYYLICK